MSKIMTMVATIALVVLGAVVPVEAHTPPPLNSACGSGELGAANESLCYAKRPRHATRWAIQGPDKLWGMRRTADFIDKQLTGVRIYRKPGLDCAVLRESRRVDVCVRVVVVDRDDVSWSGRWEAVPGSWYETIVLNTAKSKNRKRTAGHELLHSMGFTHHNEADGLVIPGKLYPDDETPLLPSASEMDVLRQHYDG